MSKHLPLDVRVAIEADNLYVSNADNAKQYVRKKSAYTAFIPWKIQMIRPSAFIADNVRMYVRQTVFMNAMNMKK